MRTAEVQSIAHAATVLEPRVEIIRTSVSSADAPKAQMFNREKTEPPQKTETAIQMETERQKRLQAIDLIFGMWKDRKDIPKDGLAYQEEIRAEW